MADFTTEWRALQAEIFAQKIVMQHLLYTMAEMAPSPREYVRFVHDSSVSQAEQQQFFRATPDQATQLREQITERLSSFFADAVAWLEIRYPAEGDGRERDGGEP